MFIAEKCPYGPCRCAVFFAEAPFSKFINHIDNLNVLSLFSRHLNDFYGLPYFLYQIYIFVVVKGLLIILLYQGAILKMRQLVYTNI